MSANETIDLSVEGHFAILTMQRSAQLNALNEQVLKELNRHLDQIESNSDIRVVLLRGEGKAFAAGADIKEMEAFDNFRAIEFAAYGQKTFSRLEKLRCPTIALIHGYALGGGMELAMSCDIRIASTDAKFGQPEVTLGIIPGFGGTQRLSRVIGPGRALSILLTGKIIDAKEALEIGLVTDVVELQDLLSVGKKLADKLASLAPVALSFVKKAVYEGENMSLDQGLVLETVLFGQCFSTFDQTEGMSAFVKKRNANFQGR